MKYMKFFLLAVLFASLTSFSGGAQADLFVSKKSGNAASKSGGGSLYVSPGHSGAKSREERSGGTFYNKPDSGNGPNFVPRQLQSNRGGLQVNPQAAARDANIREAQRISRASGSRLQKKLEAARIERERQAAERQKAWEAQQALKAQEERRSAVNSLKRKVAEGSGSSKTENTPARRVYRGEQEREYNTTGGRIFNMR